MSTSLKQRIQDDMKAAMRARERQRLGAIRLIIAAIKQVEVDERAGDLDDARVAAVLQKMLKQRRASLAQYRDAGRQDLADQEAYEIALIEGYLPQPLGEDEVARLLEAVIQETGASSPRDMGAVMRRLKDCVQGRTDMGALSAKVKQRLAQ
jgi:uncharacterized protein YqeY